MVIIWVLSSFSPSEDRGDGYIAPSSEYSISELRKKKWNKLKQIQQCNLLTAIRFISLRVNGKQTPQGGDSAHNVSLPSRKARQECKVCSCCTLDILSPQSSQTILFFSHHRLILMHVTALGEEAASSQVSSKVDRGF